MKNIDNLVSTESMQQNAGIISDNLPSPFIMTLYLAIMFLGITSAKILHSCILHFEVRIHSKKSV